MKKMFFIYILYCVLLMALFGLAAEKLLRARGFHPWKPRIDNIRVEPGGKFFKKDPLLGYVHLPGKFKVTLKNHYVFNVTHLPNSFRITHPLDSYNSAIVRPEILILGCSYTHGWGLNDEETYPWLLQEKLPDYEVSNLGVGGYATLHAFLQLKEVLKNKKPYLVILTYASFHDERNSFLRRRQKNVLAWNKLGPLVQPYGRLDRQKRLQYGMTKVAYSEFPFMRHSALVSWLENEYDKIEDRFYGSHEISKAIFEEIFALCKKHHIKLVVAGLTATSRTKDALKYCARKGIQTADISVNYSLPENNNLPIDKHPSAVANKQIAEKLYAFLEESVLPKKS